MSKKKNKYCCEQVIAAKLANNTLEVFHVEDVTTPTDFSFQKAKKPTKNTTKKSRKK